MTSVDRVVLLTGAARGIGRLIAERIATPGTGVVPVAGIRYIVLGTYHSTICMVNPTWYNSCNVCPKGLVPVSRVWVDPSHVSIRTRMCERITVF